MKASASATDASPCPEATKSSGVGGVAALSTFLAAAASSVASAAAASGANGASGGMAASSGVHATVFTEGGAASRERRCASYTSAGAAIARNDAPGSMPIPTRLALGSSAMSSMSAAMEPLAAS